MTNNVSSGLGKWISLHATSMIRQGRRWFVWATVKAPSIDDKCWLSTGMVAFTGCCVMDLDLEAIYGNCGLEEGSGCGGQ